MESRLEMRVEILSQLLNEQITKINKLTESNNRLQNEIDKLTQQINDMKNKLFFKGIII